MTMQPGMYKVMKNSNLYDEIYCIKTEEDVGVFTFSVKDLKKLHPLSDMA